MDKWFTCSPFLEVVDVTDCYTAFNIMEIIELTRYSKTAFIQIAHLMKQLSDRCIFTEEKLHAVIENANCHLYIMTEEDCIIGCATLCIYHSPTGTKASVEDVVLSEKYRGKHLGKQLMEHVLRESQKYAPIGLHLTSNSKRIAANHLYQSLGFQKKETNAYGIDIE